MKTWIIYKLDYQSENNPEVDILYYVGFFLILKISKNVERYTEGPQANSFKPTLMKSCKLFCC